MNKGTKIKHNEKGFTLIELLVVVAIIGTLATIVIASLSGSRARARDTRLKNDLSAIRDALVVRYTDRSNYKVNGSGFRGNGSGWIFLSDGVDYAKSIPQVLGEEGYLSESLAPEDELDTRAMIYFCDDGRAILYAQLEKPSEEDLANFEQSKEYCETHGATGGYGMNYALITP